MIRILFTYVVPILLPTALYFAWLTLARRPGKDAAAKPDVPWTWLLGAGVLFVGIVLGGTTIMGDGERGEVWVPAHVDAEGRLVPGRYE